MVVINTAELAGSIRPCVQDLWIARRSGQLEQDYERKLGELADLDAENEPIASLLDKIEEIGAIDRQVSRRNTLIHQLEDLMRHCIRALEHGVTHQEVSTDLADLLAPYREDTVRRITSDHALEIGAASRADGDRPRNKVLGEGHAPMSA